MANKTSKGLTQSQKDMLFMGLQLDEQFDALNTPLRVRKASLRITYVDHYPRLWVKTVNSEPECVAYMNTRTKQMIPVKPKDENNLSFCNHLFASMDKLECIIAMSYDIEPKTQRKRLRLQLRSVHSRSRSHTLHWVYKGETSPWLDEFVIANHPLKVDTEKMPEAETRMTSKSPSLQQVSKEDPIIRKPAIKSEIQVGGFRNDDVIVISAQSTGGRSMLPDSHS